MISAPLPPSFSPNSPISDYFRLSEGLRPCRRPPGCWILGVWCPVCWGRFEVTLGVVLGSLLGSFLSHFGITLGMEGDPPFLEGGFNLGSLFGDFWGLFWDPLGTPWETLGDHKGSKRGQRLSEDGSGEGPREGPQNGPFLTSPGLGSGELSPRREHSFHYFRKVAFGPHFAPFWAPFWIQEGHYARPGGSRDAPGGPKVRS